MWSAHQTRNLAVSGSSACPTTSWICLLGSPITSMVRLKIASWLPSAIWSFNAEMLLLYNFLMFLPLFEESACKCRSPTQFGQGVEGRRSKVKGNMSRLEQLSALPTLYSTTWCVHYRGFHYCLVGEGGGGSKFQNSHNLYLYSLPPPHFLSFLSLAIVA